MNTIIINAPWVNLTSRQANGSYKNISFNGVLTSASNGLCNGVGGVDGDGLAPVFEKTDKQEIQSGSLEMNIYPNPASSFISIELINGELKEIKVYDLTGRIMKILDLVNSKANIYTLNTNDLADGYYIVEALSLKGEILRKKIVVVK